MNRLASLSKWFLAGLFVGLLISICQGSCMGLSPISVRRTKSQTPPPTRIPRCRPPAVGKNFEGARTKSRESDVSQKTGVVTCLAQGTLRAQRSVIRARPHGLGLGLSSTGIPVVAHSLKASIRENPSPSFFCPAWGIHLLAHFKTVREWKRAGKPLPIVPISHHRDGRMRIGDGDAWRNQ